MAGPIEPDVIGDREEDGLVEGCEGRSANQAPGLSRRGPVAEEGQHRRAYISAFCGLGVICYVLGAWSMAIFLRFGVSVPGMAPKVPTSLPVVAASESWANGSMSEPGLRGSINSSSKSTAAHETSSNSTAAAPTPQLAPAGAHAPAGHAAPEAKVGPPTLGQQASNVSTGSSSTAAHDASTPAPAPAAAAAQAPAAGRAEPEAAMGPHKILQHLDAPVTIHHLRFPKAFQACSRYLLRDMPRTPAPKIFCFTWVRPPQDRGGTEPNLAELRELYAECDGRAVFSSFEDEQRGIVKAHDGPTGGNAKSSIQFHSVYARLVHDPAMASYDWFLDLEPDHFVRIRLMRTLLAKLPHPPGRAVYFSQVTIRGFNKEFLAEAAKQWEKVSGRLESGCPIYTSERLKGNCQGDVTMPRMGEMMADVSVMRWGSRGGALGQYYEMQYAGKGWDVEKFQIQKCCNFSHAHRDEFCP